MDGNALKNKEKLRSRLQHRSPVDSSVKVLNLLVAEVRYNHTAHSNERFYDLRLTG
jgi:hypothetical protein